MTHLEALNDIAKALNSHKVQWTLGGSMLLQLNGIPVKTEDIDILVSCSEDKLRAALPHLDFHTFSDDKHFASGFLLKANYNSIPVDFIGDFIIKYNHRIYKIPSFMVLRKEGIRLGSLEIWACAYWLMDRMDKFELIMKHFQKSPPDVGLLRLFLKEGFPQELEQAFTEYL